MTLTRRELVAGGASLVVVPWTVVGRRHSSSLRALARACRGPVIARGDHDFAAVEHGYDERWDGRRPLAVLLAEGEDDVRAAVRWAAARGVPIAARSGGHSYAGYSTPADGLVVDLRRMRNVALHHAHTRAFAQPGVQLGDLYLALGRRGATVPGGTCPSVGLGGLALGGGMGLASRALGLTCDRIEKVRIVTADGRLRTARGDDDLLWASRGGGGGNFGIVTGFTLRTAPARRAAFFFASWPWAQASEAFAAWLDFAPHAPDALTSVMTLDSSRSVHALGQFRGDEARLRHVVRPLARVAGASLSFGEESWTALQARWAGCAQLSHAACHTEGTRPGGTLPRERFAGGSDYLRHALPSHGRAAAIAALERRHGGSAALIFDAYGGAINRVPRRATAFAHRDALCSIQYLAYGPSAGAAAWVRRARHSLAPFVDGEAYQNYIDPDLHHWRRAYYGRNLGRLEAIKAAVDPDRVFDFRQAV